MKVLVAEDTLVSRKFVDLALRKHGLATILAADGQDALELLERQHQDIRLAIVDVLMPRLDGIELLAEMRAHDHWRRIPVIITTVISDMTTVHMATKLGCTRYLIKPVSEDDLIMSVQMALNPPKKNGTAANGASRSAVFGGAAAPSIVPSEPVNVTNGSMTQLMDSKALDELAGLLPSKIELVERLVAGNAAASAAELFELAKPAAFAGAKHIVELLSDIGARMAYHDARQPVPELLALLKDLTLLQAALSERKDPLLPIRSANDIPLGV